MEVEYLSGRTYGLIENCWLCDDAPMWIVGRGGTLSIESIGGREWCEACLHEDVEHDSMSACLHIDRRTKTGYCNCPNYR